MREETVVLKLAKQNRLIALQHLVERPVEDIARSGDDDRQRVFAYAHRGSEDCQQRVVARL